MGGVGVVPGEIELDVAIEVLEAFVAAELGVVGSKEPAERLRCRPLQQRPVIASPSPSAEAPTRYIVFPCDRRREPTSQLRRPASA